MTHPSTPALPLQALRGTRVLSLALNLPGPAALMRLRAMGATCVKVEPPSGDPMGHYDRGAYAQMHEGVEVLVADLKTGDGQARLHQMLQDTDVLLTSFRPSALDKLGLGWAALHARHPRLSLVAIVGAPGARAEEPGHDLTYMAEAGLVPDTALPPTLYADMGGSLMATEAVLQALLARQATGQGVCQEVVLCDAAAYLALPRQWGLTTPSGAVGGAHAGYRVYPCRDGRVALAALEPHFAAALCKVADIALTHPLLGMFQAETHAAVAAFVGARTRAELDALALAHDLPLHTLA